MLIYRVDFSDFTGAAISSNAAVNLLTQLNSFYTEMSYGLMTFAPAEAGSVVTETLRLPSVSTTYDNNFTRLLTDTRQAATDAGYAPGSFDFDVICTGAKPAAIFGAIAYVGGPGLWLANSNFIVGLLGHELGHNLGLPHASFWFTEERSVIGPGVLQEYGDPFDSMGVPGGSASHFNARYKNLLSWIPDTDALLIVSNGTYRIAAHDNPAATGTRALKITHNATQDYWIEFRQFFSNRWVTNGAGLRWGGHGAENTLLLDTTVGSPNVKNDSPIVIGRTFSDRCLDLHITAIGKGGTSPESLDVVVNRGPFPGNVAPTVSISSSASNVAVGTPVTFQATASDANSDPLAYYWEFGDTTFGSNQPTAQNAWTAAGEYVVRCTVTDMKGGRASASTVVRVGAVSTFLVEGRVTRNGAPVEGAVVRAIASRVGYSDSDGTYRISRLVAGRYTISAILEGFDVLNGGFENPMSLGPNVAGADLIAVPDSLNAITLVSTGAVWRYLDAGVAPASDWIAPNFDDASWPSGPAKFGYGIGDEITTNSFGPNASDKYITTWFRRTLVAEDAPAIDYLLFKLRRDDGAVIYLNGQELYRENLPTGTIGPTTPAVVDVGFSEERTFLSRLVPANGLLSRTNVLAVEVHQFRTNSPDLSFALEVAGLTENPQMLRPRLGTERTATNIVVSWPVVYPNWSLYSAAGLNPDSMWTRAPTSAITALNGQRYFAVAPTNPAAFYQLRKPTFCAPLP